MALFDKERERVSKRSLKRRRPIHMGTKLFADKAQTPKALSAVTGVKQQDHASVKYPLAKASAIKIDKAVFALRIDDVTTTEIENTITRHNGWYQDGKASRPSVKGKGFTHCFYLGKHGLPVEFCVGPKFAHSKQAMNWTLNPNLMTSKQWSKFARYFEALFPDRSEQIIRELRLFRLDVCVDIEVDVNSLVVRLHKSWKEAKFFVDTDTAGRIETIYIGSVSSALHACIYDQVESDKAKEQYGESPSLSPANRKRASAKEDAEFAFRSTRFEMRSIFADLPRVDTLSNWTAPFGRLEVFTIPATAKIKNNYEFWMYMDCVRWRGLAPARKYLESRGCKDVTKYETLLRNNKAPWWTPDEFAKEAQAVILGSELWKFLTQ